MFHARLLGGRSLRLGDEPVMLDSARAECLLAYLLLHRDGALPRERIAFLLWPDSTEPQARTNLRHLLHTLRRAYESLLAREPRPEEAIPASPASPPLVGRVAERQLLTARWRAAAAGGAHFVLLTGEAGIGKSRLVEELRSFCWHAGAVTAEARSYSATQGGCRSLSAGTATDGGASSRT